jgi:hypothetical protein
MIKIEEMIALTSDDIKSLSILFKVAFHEMFEDHLRWLSSQGNTLLTLKHNSKKQRVNFAKLFLPSEMLLAHSFCQNIRCSISPTLFHLSGTKLWLSFF